VAQLADPALHPRRQEPGNRPDRLPGLIKGTNSISLPGLSGPHCTALHCTALHCTAPRPLAALQGSESAAGKTIQSARSSAFSAVQPAAAWWGGAVGCRSCTGPGDSGYTTTLSSTAIHTLALTCTELSTVPHYNKQCSGPSLQCTNPQIGFTKSSENSICGAIVRI
jgi:hypothetical protein